MSGTNHVRNGVWAEEQINEHVHVINSIYVDIPLLLSIAQRIVQTFQASGKLYIIGNGGSAADAQHWAAELSGRFYIDRKSLPAFALTPNSSQVTAIANDFAFDEGGDFNAAVVEVRHIVLIQTHCV